MISNIKLTPEQEKQWDDVMALLGTQAPGFSHIFHQLLVNNDYGYRAVMSRDVPVAATDAKNVIINPDTFFSNKYTLMGRAFIVAHEIVHNMYHDVETLHVLSETGLVPDVEGTKTLPFENETFQISADQRINALLIQSRIGTMPTDGQKKQGVDANTSIFDAYAQNYKKRKDPDEGQGDDDGDGQGKGRQGQGNQGNPGKGFDKILKPGESTGQNPQEVQAEMEANKNKFELEMEVARELEMQRHCGNLPAGMLRLFKEVLEPEIPWQEKIKCLVQAIMGSGGETWRRPNRRYIGQDLYLPSPTGFNAGWVCCWGDTSGSMGNAEIAAYFAELPAILADVRPKRLTVLWCDAAIAHIDEIQDPADIEEIAKRGVGGGGGTSVGPVFDWIREQNYEKPDMFIGFTDGYVSFPAVPPDYPVIWGSVTDQEYPFGEVVRIMKRAK